ncbi:serine/threonine protein phosphatase [Pseudomonas syringae]|uniref:metallophosphoesterase n=1 Tax=Pseudomonas syringae TaxID=317 RepID=UPI000C1CB736|nr:metallophosphoesterase [Pseudomonas syringae]PIO94363.1 serine/threonine protein phosphatase [Pseudomonas syringae]
MKALILSDLHIEFEPYHVPPVDVDLIVLAGDIHKGVRGVRWANEMFSVPVVYVVGNHEFYSGHLDYTLEKMRAASDNHVHVLDRDTFVFEGCRFLGATCWTDYTSSGDMSTAMAIARSSMNDFKTIRADTGYRRLRPDDLVTRNHLARDWLSSQLDAPFEGRTVVISHHCPVPEVAGDNEEGHLSASYTNSWHSLVSRSDAWIFGHTHHAIDQILGGCRLVSNPKGYPGESTGFDPMKIIEI